MRATIVPRLPRSAPGLRTNLVESNVAHANAVSGFRVCLVQLFDVKLFEIDRLLLRDEGRRGLGRHGGLPFGDEHQGDDRDPPRRQWRKG